MVFEVDDLDMVERQGWSVIVDGHLVTAQPAAAAVAVLEHLAPWAPGDRPFLMCIVIDVVTGRWVRASAPANHLTGAATCRSSQSVTLASVSIAAWGAQ